MGSWYYGRHSSNRVTGTNRVTGQGRDGKLTESPHRDGKGLQSPMVLHLATMSRFVRY